MDLLLCCAPFSHYDLHVFIASMSISAATDDDGGGGGVAMTIQFGLLSLTFNLLSYMPTTSCNGARENKKKQ